MHAVMASAEGSMLSSCTDVPWGTIVYMSYDLSPNAPGDYTFNLADRGSMWE